MNGYRSSSVGFGNHPAPRVPTGLICFIIAFVIAGAINQKYALEIGILLTYLLIKFWQFIEKKIKIKW